MIKIKDILKDIDKNCKNFSSDAKLILQDLLYLANDYELLLNHDLTLTKQQVQSFAQMWQELINGKPLSKIIKKKEFWKNDFYTNEKSLDPRPDSECIIESVLQFVSKTQYLKILELGLGTGCLLFSLLNELHKAFGYGLEKNLHTLQIARKNNFHANRVKLYHGSWKNINNIFSNQKFDIIISNPPYIRLLDWGILNDNVRKFDPICALNGGHNGLYAYRDIYHNLSNITHKDALLFLEIGKNQALDVRKIYNKEFDLLKINKDLSGIIRCLIFRKKNI